MQRFLLVDDHPMVLDGTKILLQTSLNIIIDTENNVDNVLKRININEYDLYILDINMKFTNGIELSRKIKDLHKNSRILLYTGFDLYSYYNLILDGEVDGIVSKTANKEQLIQAVQATLRGELLLPKDFLTYINENIRNNPKTDITLKEREIEVLNYIAVGYTNKAMACELNVTQRTIDNYISRIFSKLDVYSRPEAILVAVEKGWLKSDTNNTLPLK